MNTSHMTRISGLVLAALAATSGHAQQAPAPAPQLVVAKPIIVSPVTGDDKKELVLMSISIQPTGVIAMHTHPGDCVSSVLEGIVEVMAEGQTPLRVAAGGTYNFLRGTVHGVRNVGETPVKLLNGLLVDKGVPRTQPVAQPPKPQ